MDTKSRVVQIKTTLPQEVWKIWDDFEKRHLGASKSSLFRMLLIEYGQLRKEVEEAREVVDAETDRPDDSPPSHDLFEG